MRDRVLPVFLALLLSASCSQPGPSAPIQYISLQYTLTPGSGTGGTAYVIDIKYGSLPCDRAKRNIVITGQSGPVAARLTLRGDATAPAETTAETNTAGNVQMDFYVPRDLISDLAQPPSFEFSTAAADNALLCTITSMGQDPFSNFNASFTCLGQQTTNGLFNVTAGSIVATMCPPL